MTQSLDTPSSPRLPAAAPDALHTVSCPFCHTQHASSPPEALLRAESWSCVRCGQLWDAGRLATVEAYTAWAADYDRRQRT